MRKLETFTVDSKQHIGDSIALISDEGVVFCRPTHQLTEIPEPGETCQLETLLYGDRITGLQNSAGTWIFRYTTADLAEQDRNLHDTHKNLTQD